MTLETAPVRPASAKPSKVPAVFGWTLSVLIALLMGVMPIIILVTAPGEMTKGAQMYGYPEGAMKVLAYIEIASVVLFLIPRTAMLGAILLTGYLGGAVATHVQGPVPQPGNAPVGDPYFMALIVGMVVWLALLLRDARVRQLLPIAR